jgi:integrase
MGNVRKPRAWRTKDGIRIRPLRNRTDSYSYRVEIPEAITGGTRILKQFKTTEEAESYAAVMVVQRKNHGISAFNLSEKQRRIAEKSFLKLTHNNLQPAVLLEAVDFYISHNKPEGGDISVTALIEKYIAGKSSGALAKNKRALRERSLSDLESRLGAFRETFGERLMKSVTAEEIGKWLDDPTKTAQTRRNFFTVLHGFFRYAHSKKYVGSVPLDPNEKPASEERSPGVLTVEQAATLLKAAQDHPELELGWFVVLGLFLGVRTEELTRLKVRDVMLSEGLLRIGPDVAKKRRIRNVQFAVHAEIDGKKICVDPVLAWLNHLPAPKGEMIAPVGWDGKFYKRLVAYAGIEDWPSNAMRHSYASYLYSFTGNAAEVCARLGHRQDDMLFDHYRTLVTRKAAHAYFTITPKVAANVISMASAAA